jgi:hypothetical protein
MSHPEFSKVGKFGMFCLLKKLEMMKLWKIQFPFGGEKGEEFGFSSSDLRSPPPKEDLNHLKLMIF